MRSKPELVFAFVAAVGTDLAFLEGVLNDYLRRYHYGVNLIRLSDTLKDHSLQTHFGYKLEQDTEYGRIRSLMDAGNLLRQRTGCNDVLACCAINKIVDERRQISANEESQPTERGTVHVLHSLKHKDEVALLRNTYGDGFFLIGVYCHEEDRLNHLLDRKNISKEDARELIQRDFNEADEFGQKTRDTFQLADVFVNLNPNKTQDVQKELDRFIKLVFGNPFNTPTRDEHAMFLAYASSLRSGSLARQVGAVITSAAGEIIATGSNDVPSAKGGQYWPGESDQRDYVKGFDSNTKRRDEIIVEIMQRVSKAQDENDGQDVQGMLIDGRKILKGTSLFHLTEFGRDVHAEMEAILSCTRTAVSPRGGTVYTTTFPCHNCAKHIVAAGIDRVVYVEPYPKSLAKELHDDSIVIESSRHDPDKVNFVPFVGVGPRRYFDLFSLSLSRGYSVKRKEKTGEMVQWAEAQANPRTPILQSSCSEREDVALGKLNKLSEIGDSTGIK